MRFNNKEKDNGWKTGFALFPERVGDTTIWLERFLYRKNAFIREVRFYEGCAERVGWPCNCIRH